MRAQARYNVCMSGFGRRRALVGGVHLTVLASGLGCASNGTRVSVAPTDGQVAVDLVLIPSLNIVGGSVGLRVDGVDEELIAVRVSEGEVVVLTRVCGHMGCKVRFSGAAQELECPCHGSRFALDGALLEGPSRTPLRRFDARIEAGTLRFAV